MAVMGRRLSKRDRTYFHGYGAGSNEDAVPQDGSGQGVL